MNPDQATALREPFAAEVIGKLPKISCGACSQAAKNQRAARDKHCDKHQVTKCAECGNYLTTAHLHLDYVGHAATTDRLLKVDPEWTWRPMATEVDTGFPRFDPSGGLWILLTVAGVTRPGYGDGANPKEVISDAIRNAAMRFGVALDLWAKEDLHATDDSRSVPHDPPAVSNRGGASRGDGPSGDLTPEEAEHKRAHDQLSTSDLKLDPADRKVINQLQRKRLWTIASEAGVGETAVRNIVIAVTEQDSTAKIPRWLYDRVIQEIQLVGQGTQA